LLYKLIVLSLGIVKNKNILVMNKVNQIIDVKIFDKLEQLVNELSTNEFVEEIGDEIFEETGEEVDNLKEVIGERLTPLLIKFSQLVLNN
jgi:hypothetical protein